ncbi:ATP-binding protein [Streptomyces sp. NPDC005122]
MTTFTLRFTAAPRGARLARRLASHQMDTWGWAYGTRVHDTVKLIVAALAANAVSHGRVPGRDAGLRLSPETGQVRVEVSDTRGDRLPVARDAGGCEDGGRGLVLVASLAEKWGTAPRPGAPGKTVWAIVTGETAVSSSCPFAPGDSSLMLRTSSVGGQAQAKQSSHEGKVRHSEI